MNVLIKAQIPKPLTDVGLKRMENTKRDENIMNAIII